MLVCDLWATIWLVSFSLGLFLLARQHTSVEWIADTKVYNYYAFLIVGSSVRCVCVWGGGGGGGESTHMCVWMTDWPEHYGV